MLTVTGGSVSAASSSPTVCVNTAITPITHTTSGFTGIGTPANLPAGLSASFASNSITISGTPTASGTFNYSIPLTGGCGSVNATGTITVNPLPVAAGTITGTATVCQGQSGVAYFVPVITNATSYTWSYSGTGATFTDGTTRTPTITFASNATSGNLTVYGVNTCGNGTVSANYAITVNPTSVGGSIAGSTSVCSGINSTTLTLSGYTGTITKWQSSTSSTFASSVSDIANTTTTLTATNLATTTYYRAVVTSGACSSANSSTATVTVNTLSTAPTGITGVTTICNGSSTTLNLSGGSVGTGATAEWFTGSCGGTSAGIGNSITVSPTSNTVYYVRYSGTCNTTTCASVTVTVNNVMTTAADTRIFCINGTTTSITTNAVNEGQYVVLDVIKGFNYTFSIGNVFSGNENITVLDDSTNANVTPTASVSSASGASLTWTASLSGKVKIVLSSNNCSNGTAGGAMTLLLNSLGNTQDSQTTSGTDAWIGHFYNAGGATPAPFTNANYAGYYNVATENFSENFGSNTSCAPVLSAGIQRASMYTEGFAVRYRMKSTRAAGCYFVKVTGDDGVRLYIDNSATTTPTTKVFDRWAEQSPTTYDYILVNLPSSANLVLDYYENAGQNQVSFQIAPFDPAANTITAPATTSFCSGGDPAVIEGSFKYNSLGTEIANPYINYQWQISVNGAAYSNISGAISRTYNPPATINTTTANIVTKYRRIATVNTTNAIGVTCNFNQSNEVTITTSPNASIASVTGTSPLCIAGSATYSANSVVLSGGTGGWTSDNTAVATVVSSTGVVTAVGAGTCNIIYTVTGGCGGTVSSQQSITVNPSLPASVTISASTASTICSGTSVTFTATPTNGGATPIYQWKLNGLNVGTNSVTYTNAALSNGDTISLEMTSSATPCLTGNPATSNTVTMNVNATPVAPVLNNVVLTCSQTSANETWASIPNSTDYRFDVSLDSSFGTFISGYQDVSVAPSASPSAIVNGLTPGATYYVRVRTVTGCGISANSNVATMSVPITRTTDGGVTWDNGIPDNTKKAVFVGTGSIAMVTPINACSCQINSGVNVVVGVPGGTNTDAILKLENGLNVQGTGSLTFENNASLIQVNDAAVNTGTIIYKRISSEMKNFDFTYWSSPVSDQNSGPFQTLKALSPNTLFDKYFSYANGNWVTENVNNIMKPGKGYIIRTPKPGVYGMPYPETVVMPYSQPVKFVGVPNNGLITIPSQGLAMDNLIGNPYPSPIDADSFINENAALIDGALYFWTHNTGIKPNGSLYVYSSNDYATYTLTGGAGTMGNFVDVNNNGIYDAGDIIDDSNKPNGKIAAGQSFFVTTKATGNFVFNNGMRNTADVLASGSNSQFFKNLKNQESIRS